MPSVLRKAPVLLKVLAHGPTDFFHCLHCEQLFDAAGVGATVRRQTRASYPPEMLEEAGHPAAWSRDLSARYNERLHVRVVDPQSPEGFLKSLRYWVRRYPTFIVDRRAKYAGWDPVAVERLLEDWVFDGGEV